MDAGGLLNSCLAGRIIRVTPWRGKGGFMKKYNRCECFKGQIEKDVIEMGEQDQNEITKSLI